MYIVIARTVGLTRSPPGVTIAAKTAMPEDDASAGSSDSQAELMIPTRDRPYRTIGNSMISPKARNSVVTKSK